MFMHKPYSTGSSSSLLAACCAMCVLGDRHAQPPLHHLKPLKSKLRNSRASHHRVAICRVYMCHHSSSPSTQHMMCSERFMARAYQTHTRTRTRTHEQQPPQAAAVPYKRWYAGVCPCFDSGDTTLASLRATCSMALCLQVQRKSREFWLSQFEAV